jgi:hypothetical protein
LVRGFVASAVQLLATTSFTASLHGYPMLDMIFATLIGDLELENATSSGLSPTMAAKRQLKLNGWGVQTNRKPQAKPLSAYPHGCTWKINIVLSLLHAASNSFVTVTVIPRHELPARAIRPVKRTLESGILALTSSSEAETVPHVRLPQPRWVFF